jgi:hypothetical protein
MKIENSQAVPKVPIGLLLQSHETEFDSFKQQKNSI